MNFTTDLSKLIIPLSNDPEIRAMQENFLLEERINSTRLAEYEAHIKLVRGWNEFQENHVKYLVDKVYSRDLLGVAFTQSQSSLIQIDSQQSLLRVECIDNLIKKEEELDGIKLTPEFINYCIAATNENERYKKLLGMLTDSFNQLRSDGRPSFTAFNAQFIDLLNRENWLEYFCKRCGLGKYFSDQPVTLALMRYQVEDVLNSYPSSSMVFAAPTVLDQVFSLFFHPTPIEAPWGHPVDLDPSVDSANLVSEVIHARINYQPKHWLRIGILNAAVPKTELIPELRCKHRERLRYSTNRPDYGAVFDRVNGHDNDN